MSSTENSLPTSTYPSGAPMPQYGPSTDDEFITDGLEWATAMLEYRDRMNAAVHCGPVRWSPVTTSARIALVMWRRRLWSERLGIPASELDARNLREARRDNVNE